MTREERIRFYFRLSVFLKGAFSLMEMLAGVLAFFVPVSVLTNFAVSLVQGELAEDPSDRIAQFLLHLAQGVSLPGGYFLALYLLSRGLIKLALIVGLLQYRLWAYPSSIAVLGLFILYQVYQMTVVWSTFLLLLTLFDLLVVWLIWKEYQVLKTHLQAVR